MLGFAPISAAPLGVLPDSTAPNVPDVTLDVFGTSSIIFTATGAVSVTLGVPGALNVDAAGLAAVSYTALGGVSVLVVDPGDPAIPVDVSATGIAECVFTAVGGVTVQLRNQNDFWSSLRKVKVASVAETSSYQMLDYEEVDNIAFDFSKEMLADEFIESAQCQIVVSFGSDGAPDTVLDAPLHLDTMQVVARVKGNYPNTAYKMRVLATLNSGRRLVGSALLSFSIK